MRLEQRKRVFDDKLEEALLIKYYCDLLSLTEKKDNDEIILTKKNWRKPKRNNKRQTEARK